MKPHILMLQEHNTRTGFFEPEQYRSVLSHLPTYLQPIIAFAYTTGWRIPSEVLPLEWQQVDFEAGEVRLDPGQTKNREGRVFPFTVDLHRLLATQKSAAETFARQHRQLKSPWVFFRLVAKGRRGPKEPRRIKAFTKAWRAACFAAGCRGRIPHDLRRTAVRNLVRAGVPERVAMQLTGHKTRSVFERYNIVSETDLREAVAKLSARTGTVLGQSAVVGGRRENEIDEFVEEMVEAPPGFEPGVEVLQISSGGQ